MHAPVRNYPASKVKIALQMVRQGVLVLAAVCPVDQIIYGCMKATPLSIHPHQLPSSEQHNRQYGVAEYKST